MILFTVLNHSHLHVDGVDFLLNSYFRTWLDMDYQLSMAIVSMHQSFHSISLLPSDKSSLFIKRLGEFYFNKQKLILRTHRKLRLTHDKFRLICRKKKTSLALSAGGRTFTMRQSFRAFWLCHSTWAFYQYKASCWLEANQSFEGSAGTYFYGITSSRLREKKESCGQDCSDHFIWSLETYVQKVYTIYTL